jgi:hypothetical protein
MPKSVLSLASDEEQDVQHFTDICVVSGIERGGYIQDFSFKAEVFAASLSGVK